MRANGGHSTRVFAIPDASLAAGEKLRIEKRQPFRPTTIRTLYPGRHYVELLVNGVARGKRAFEFSG